MHIPNLTDEIIADLKAKHGDELHAIKLEVNDDGDELTVVCKKPGRQNFSRFAAEGAEDAYKATRNMFFDCLVWPEAQVLTDLFQREPGLAVSFGNSLSRIAKVNQRGRERRL